jgi:hypothetical protein
MSMVVPDDLDPNQLPPEMTLGDTLGEDASVSPDAGSEIDPEALKAMIPLLLPKGADLVGMVAGVTSFGLSDEARNSYIKRLPSNPMLLEGLKMIGFDKALAELVSKLFASSGGKIDPVHSLIAGSLMIGVAVLVERRSSSNPVEQVADLVDAPPAPTFDDFPFGEVVPS